MKKTCLQIIIAIVLLMILAACAGPNTVQGTPAPNGKVAGFWEGLIQGLLAAWTFILSIFSKDFNVYEVHNDGFWYNLGFVLGAGILFGGGTRIRRHRDD